MRRRLSGRMCARRWPSGTRTPGLPRPLRGLITAAETSPLANRVWRTACRDFAMTGAIQGCRFHGGSRGSEPNRDVQALG